MAINLMLITNLIMIYRINFGGEKRRKRKKEKGREKRRKSIK
jgi:hypothetical protein